MRREPGRVWSGALDLAQGWGAPRLLPNRLPALRARGHAGLNDISAMGARVGLIWAHRRATGDAAGRPHGVGRETVAAGDPAEPFRYLVRCPQAFRDARYGLPDALRELQGGDVLGKVVKSVEESERVAQGAESRGAEARRPPGPPPFAASW